jgi:FkbM family methyltransferase
MTNKLKKTLISFLEYIRYKKSYSQDGEDVVLSAFFESKRKHKGFFVDVGAHHPVRFSNTWMFYRKGWRGINIDPTPGSMKMFNILRSRDINLELGIGGEEGFLNFYCFNEPALNTFDEKVATARNTGKPYKITKTIPVKIQPLSDVLTKYLPANTTIDFMSVDVEGLDLEVLKSNDWIRFSPKFILVEDTSFSLNQPQLSDTHKYLTEKGYSLCAAVKRTNIYQNNNISI